MTPGERLYHEIASRARSLGLVAMSCTLEWTDVGTDVRAVYDGAALALEMKPDRGWYWVRPRRENVRPRVQMAQYGDGGWWFTGLTDPKPTEDYGRLEPSVKVGDRVIFGRYSGSEAKLDGDERLFITEDDVLAVIEK